MKGCFLPDHYFIAASPYYTVQLGKRLLWGQHLPGSSHSAKFLKLMKGRLDNQNTKSQPEPGASRDLNFSDGYLWSFEPWLAT